MSISNMSQKKRGDANGQVLEKTRTREKIARPPLYKVLFHNDDYTPMEFVVLVLMSIFSKQETEATTIMLHVHRRGQAIAGLYPFAVAETKVAEVMSAAEKAQYPLLVTMEPATDGEKGDEPST
jgi:ATP-dependent Clp protease adaptor protein ClpS